MTLSYNTTVMPPIPQSRKFVQRGCTKGCIRQRCSCRNIEIELIDGCIADKNSTIIVICPVYVTDLI